MTQRASDIVEQHAAKALPSVVGGVIALAASTLFFIYSGGGMMYGLAVVLALAGIGLLIYAGICFSNARKVTSVSVECCYCSHKNLLTAAPDDDFTCAKCNRLVPVVNGVVIEVSQVRCGYCNALNYYSAKTEVLLCEECNREVPVSLEDGRVAKTLPKGFAKVDDENLYELVLTGHNGQHTEELISALQHMLALNRNQVKQMLAELPVTLLSGIPRMKAEMLQTQLSVHGGQADFRVIN